MSWIKKIMPSRIRTEGGNKKVVPEGLWKKCPRCGSVLYRPELERTLEVCPKCDFHMPLTGRKRLIGSLDEETGKRRWGFLDDDSGEEIAGTLEPVDPLRFRDSKRYRDRIVQTQKKTGEKDALIAMKGTLEGRPVVACAFDFAFMGGSMGSVVGERFVRAARVALDEGRPLICFSSTGGARMQESLFSLMQMAKTSAALGKLADAQIPYFSILTNPTTGGVSASLGMLGDVNIGEPEALIGFAGPRVIQQTVRETLPPGFQRSEFLLEHGALDMIVDRREMREKVSLLLSLLCDGRQEPGAQTATDDDAGGDGEASPDSETQGAELEAEPNDS